jgi:hypothetical protein
MVTEQGGELEGTDALKEAMKQELIVLTEKKDAGEEVDEARIAELVASLNSFSREENEELLDTVEEK